MKRMKRLFLTLTVFSFISSALLAQNEKSFDVTGKYSLDVNFDPAAIFDANAGNMFSMPNIKLRIFSSESKAFRLSTNLDVMSQKNNIGLNGDYEKYSYFRISIAPGLEKHFGEGRLRPYYGFEVPLAYKSSKSERKTGNFTTEVNNVDNNDYISFGFNAVLGIDFYIYKGLYLGAEFTPGLVYHRVSDKKVDGETTSEGGNAFNFDTSSASGLKLGFRF